MDFDSIKETLAGNPELLKKTLLHITNDTEQGKTLLTNYADQYAVERIKANTKETYGKVDELLKEAGFDKGGMKTTDALSAFIKQAEATAAKKGSSAREKELAAELDRLKESGSHNEHWKKTFEEKALEFNAKEADLIAKINGMQQAQRLGAIQSELKAAISGLTYNPAIPTEAIDALRSQAIQQLTANAKQEGDKLVFYKADGSPYLNEMHTTATASEILRTQLASVLHNTTAGGGANNNNISSNGASIALDGANIKTRVSLVKHFSEAMRAKGIAQGSQEFNTLFNKAKETYNYYSLPEH
jgi:hypothetical protein